MPLKRALRSAPALVLDFSGALQVAQPFSFSAQSNLRLSTERAGQPTARTHAGTMVAVHATSDYLSSLSSAPKPKTMDEAHWQSPVPALGQQDEEDVHVPDIPDDHYSKNHPNAGWRGYANPQWGGYLDALPSNRLQEGKKSDYGDDVRWGAEVYLNSIDGRGGSH